ncbi:MAG: L-serine ammonia-lyase [Beutenbergiaceae bacterium]
MALSTLDMFSVGIGPSSSHTVGPMRAAARFADSLSTRGLMRSVARVQVELFGSLGATGRGHGSDKAVILGLMGESPEAVDTGGIDARIQAIVRSGELRLAGDHAIAFAVETDITLHRRRSLPAHPNGMVFRASTSDDRVAYEATYYSVGGGFVVDADAAGRPVIVDDPTTVRYPFSSGAELLRICAAEQCSIGDLMSANESSWRPQSQTRGELLHIWDVMKECVHNGCTSTAEFLPGALNVPRRAPMLSVKLNAGHAADDPIRAMDWVSLFALAVNEENAAGGRVVTAPTNGAAGIVPAVLHYYTRFVPSADDDGVVTFLLTAAAIGILFKENASISGAEVGCQGEVGSACAMAAAGLCAVMGGTPAQVENAAEIGIEHNLGLTCDPIGGLVQIPCIERNAIAASKAINAARMAMHADGSHRVSLDQAIKTMRETGADMKLKYKETSRGGLAVNVIEC